MRQGIKMLELAIDLVIFLSIVSSALLIKNAVDPIAATIQLQAQQRAAALSESQFSPYDGHIVPGSSLTTAVDRYSNQPTFYIYVQLIRPSVRNFGLVADGAGTSCPSFNFTSGQLSYSSNMTCSVVPANLVDESNASYILPQARFRSVLIKDASRRVVGIFFREQ